MFSELHEKYEHLFPNIHGNKNLIHRKKIARKKLNDLILPLDSWTLISFNNMITVYLTFTDAQSIDYFYSL